MQLFTQLWPAVIEILSMVLCDYCCNEFSMAVIFFTDNMLLLSWRKKKEEDGPEVGLGLGCVMRTRFWSGLKARLWNGVLLPGTN